MRHGGRAFLAGCEVFLRLADVRALQVANFRRELFERACDDGERRHVLGMTVALNDLRREAHGCDAELLARDLLDARVDVRIGADGARELADGDDLLRVLDALDVALDLGAPQEQLQAEGHRLCVDAVRPADARRVLELDGAAAQYFEELFEVVDDDVGGLLHHDAECRVLDIARRQSLVDIFRVLADILGDVREEGDDVVIRDLLDLLDARQVELRLGADVRRSLLRDLPEFRHGLAGRDLDFEHGLKLMLQRPDIAHFRIRIAFYHGCDSSCHRKRARPSPHAI